MHKLALFRLHLIVFLWGFTAILGKLIHANAEILVFYRMLFAAIFLFIFIRVFRKESIKVSKKIFFSAGCNWVFNGTALVLLFLFH
jgi:drug/metabolite transporter (DMT)-like permease